MSSAFPYGQADVFFAPEVRGLLRAGVDVIAVPVRPTATTAQHDLAVQAERRPLFDLRILVGALTMLVRRPGAVFRALRIVFRSYGPAVLTKNLAAFPKALWIAGLAIRVDADHIHAHWAGPPSTVAMVAGLVSAKPWSFTAHFADIAADNLLREKCVRASFVRFISRSMMDLARATAPGIDESRWVLLHLGIDLPQAPVVGRELHDPPVVLMAARLDPEKRPTMLVDVVAILRRRGVRLDVVMAGSGRLEGDVRRAIDTAGLTDVVHLTGFVPNSQLLQWYRDGAVDLVVLTSEAEGIPVSLMEPLAVGIPVVACAAGGIPELLGDGCGELVALDDVEGFADAIDRVLRSPDLRRILGERGRTRVRGEFSADDSAKAQLELFGFEDDALGADG